MIQHLIQRFYDAASIQRWNDHIRPVEFTELDKQAHKMVIAYVIAKFEEDRLGRGSIDWISIIEWGIFEFLHRTVVTDIKPPVFHRMIKEKGDELNQHVFDKLEDDMKGMGGDFRDKFKNYYLKPPHTIERSILRAAHYLATQWEFKIIYHAAPFVYGIEKTKQTIENQIEDHYDLIGVQKILLGKKSHGFVDLCGQLRFQKRWAHSPRIPETSVLGHMLIVAATAYLCSLEMGIRICDNRFYNNFFAGLFHDLPEVLTKDIISPVKQSVEGLDDIIKEYEDYRMNEDLFPLLPESWHDEIVYFTKNEFLNKIKIDEKENEVSFKDLNNKYNLDNFSPIDGELLETCDKLAAFVEANLSIRYGIKSETLEEAQIKIYNEYGSRKFGKLNFKEIFDFFKV